MAKSPPKVKPPAGTKNSAQAVENHNKGVNNMASKTTKAEKLGIDVTQYIAGTSDVTKLFRAPRAERWMPQWLDVLDLEVRKSGFDDRVVGIRVTIDPDDPQYLRFGRENGKDRILPARSAMRLFAQLKLGVFVNVDDPSCLLKRTAKDILGNPIESSGGFVRSTWDGVLKEDGVALLTATPPVAGWAELSTLGDHLIVGPPITPEFIKGYWAEVDNVDTPYPGKEKNRLARIFYRCELMYMLLAGRLNFFIPFGPRTLDEGMLMVDVWEEEDSAKARAMYNTNDFTIRESARAVRRQRGATQALQNGGHVPLAVQVSPAVDADQAFVATNGQALIVGQIPSGTIAQYVHTDNLGNEAALNWKAVLGQNPTGDALWINDAITNRYQIQIVRWGVEDQKLTHNGLGKVS